MARWLSMPLLFPEDQSSGPLTYISGPHPPGTPKDPELSSDCWGTCTHVPVYSHRFMNNETNLSGK